MDINITGLLPSASGFGLGLTPGLDFNGYLNQAGRSNGLDSMEQSLMKTLQSMIDLMTQLLQGAKGGQQGGSECKGGSHASGSNPTPSRFTPKGNQDQASLGNLFQSLGEFASVLGGLLQGGMGANFGSGSVQV
jgi:hypothetical protein